MRSAPSRPTRYALREALALAWGSAPRLALAQTILVALRALLPLVSLVAVKQVIDAASTALQHEWGQSLAEILTNPLARNLTFWMLVGAMAIALQSLLRAALGWTSELHAMAVSDNVHERLHTKLANVDIAFFENHSQQNHLHLVQSQAMGEPIRILNNMFQTLHGIISLLGIIGLLASIHPIIPAALAIGGFPVLLIRIERSRRLYQWRRDLIPLERQASYAHSALSTGSFAPELRVFSQFDFFRSRFEAVRKQLRQARLGWRRYLLSRELLVQAIMLLVLALVLAWLGWRLLQGAVTLGVLIMAVQALQRGQGQLNSLAATLADSYQSLLFMNSFYDLMRLPSSTEDTAKLSPPSKPISEGIRFENVCFAYPGTSRLILDDVSFTIKPNEIVTLVGANGSGKSTIIKLLMQLYQPTSGRIVIDGVDIAEIEPQAWRRRIGVLFQDFIRYQLSVAENIWLGDTQLPIDSELITTASQQADLTELIGRWPQGIHTLLGRWLHAGIEPSVGQWQKIGFARALLRKSDILILDEPASSMDAANIQKMGCKLRDMAKDRLIILASHRLELALAADRAIMLQNGRIVEEGVASELRQGGGHFATLFEDGCIRA